MILKRKNDRKSCRKFKLIEKNDFLVEENGGLKKTAQKFDFPYTSLKIISF